MKIDKYKEPLDILIGFLIYALITLHNEDDHHVLESKTYIEFTVDRGFCPWYWKTSKDNRFLRHLQAETMVFPSRSNDSQYNLMAFSNVIWNIYDVWTPALMTFFKENLTVDLVENVTAALRY